MPELSIRRSSTRRFDKKSEELPKKAMNERMDDVIRTRLRMDG
jgi:hypothetical protein